MSLTFQKGTLQWAQVDAGYRQMIEQVELQRLQAHAHLIMAKAVGPRDLDQKRREYNTLAAQLGLLVADYEAWKSENPEPEREETKKPESPSDSGEFDAETQAAVERAGLALVDGHVSN